MNKYEWIYFAKNDTKCKGKPCPIPHWQHLCIRWENNPANRRYTNGTNCAHIMAKLLLSYEAELLNKTLHTSPIHLITHSKRMCCRYPSTTMLFTPDYLHLIYLTWIQRHLSCDVVALHDGRIFSDRWTSFDQGLQLPSWNERSLCCIAIKDW